MRKFLIAMAAIGIAYPASLGAVPADPLCPSDGMSRQERQLVEFGKSEETPDKAQKDAAKNFDKRIKKCAKSNGWSNLEKIRIEQLNIWEFMAESRADDLAGTPFKASDIRKAVGELTQQQLGTKIWILDKDTLFALIKPQLSRIGPQYANLAVGDIEISGISGLAANYAKIRQLEIQLGLEAAEPAPATRYTVAAKPETPPAPAPPSAQPAATDKPAIVFKPSAPPAPVAAKAASTPAPISAVPPAAPTAAPPKAAPKNPTEKPKEPVKLVKVDYSPMLEGKIYPAEPWSCGLYAMPLAMREGWDASYETPRRAEILLAKETAVNGCQVKHGWPDAVAKEVDDYTLKWIIAGDLEKVLLKTDPTVSLWSVDIRKLPDTDLASAKTLSHSPGLQKVMEDHTRLYGVMMQGREAKEEEIWSIIRLHKMWAQIELFHRQKGVKQK